MLKCAMMLLLALLPCLFGKVIMYNGTPDSKSAGQDNTALLNTMLASMAPGDTLMIENQTFWLAGGVQASDLIDATIHLDGTLRFLPGDKH